jgi:peptidoglycan/LPS O-acetylase OafA/YrhL
MSKAAENSFNAVRLLAALQVVYVHATAHLRLTPTFGYDWIVQFPGVPIFFAISGYLVFDSLLRLPTSREFFRHRASRIYPALIVNIAILEMLFALGGGLHLDAVGPVKAFFFELFYMATASDELGFRYAGARAMRSFDGFFQIYPSGVLWTLTVELTFYAVVPLFLFAKAAKGLAAGLIAAFCIVSIATNDWIDKSLLFSLSVIPYFWMFGIGMLFRLWLPDRSAMPSAGQKKENLLSIHSRPSILFVVHSRADHLV